MIIIRLALKLKRKKKYTCVYYTCNNIIENIERWSILIKTELNLLVI